MKLADLVGFLENPEEYEITYRGQSVPHYLNDACRIDSDSKFFVAGHEFGATHLIHVEAYRGKGFEAAWGLWIDESPTIPEEELIEAYGIEGESFQDLARAEMVKAPNYWEREAWDAWHVAKNERAKAMLDKAAQDASDGLCDYPELIEGYENQDNSSGTGIVDVGHYAWMHEADLDEVVITRKEKEAKAAE